MVTIIVICFLSFLLMIIFQREIRHVAKAQIHILGQENEEIIYSKRLRVLLFLYTLSIILLMILVYFLYLMP